MSNINPQNINGTFPIAGQDNNSQGFRDNFTNAVNNFTFAATELTDLQTNAILKAPLGSVGQTVTNNNLNQAQLVAAQLLETTETVFPITTTSGGFTIDWTVGHFQTLAPAAGSVTATFASTWPASGLYTKLRLQVTVTSTAYTLTLPAAVTAASYNNIQGCTSGVITFPATGVYLYEFSSYNAGSTVLIADVLNNADNVASDFTIAGNLITSGGRIDAGYQYSAATTGFNDTVGVTKSRVIYDPAGTLANGTLTLPAGNVDAKIVTVSSTQIITAFQVLPSIGTTLVPSANITLAAGTSATYFYHATESKWYKVG